MEAQNAKLFCTQKKNEWIRPSYRLFSLLFHLGQHHSTDSHNILGKVLRHHLASSVSISLFFAPHNRTLISQYKDFFYLQLLHLLKWPVEKGMVDLKEITKLPQIATWQKKKNTDISLLNTWYFMILLNDTYILINNKNCYVNNACPNSLLLYTSHQTAKSDKEACDNKMRNR